VSRDHSPYTDDAYESEYDERAAYEEAYHEDDADDSLFPYPASSFGWPPGLLGGGTADVDRTAVDDHDGAHDGERVEDEYAEDDSWLDEGLIGLTLIVGLVLFLFPEPATSAAGILLLLVGAIAWLADALT
jgi:hypothetical protein